MEKCALAGVCKCWNSVWQTVLSPVPGGEERMEQGWGGGVWDVCEEGVGIAEEACATCKLPTLNLKALQGATRFCTNNLSGTALSRPIEASEA